MNNIYGSAMRIPGPCVELRITFVMAVTTMLLQCGYPAIATTELTRPLATFFRICVWIPLIARSSLNNTKEVSHIFYHVFHGEMHLPGNVSVRTCKIFAEEKPLRWVLGWCHSCLLATRLSLEVDGNSQQSLPERFHDAQKASALEDLRFYPI